MYGNVEKLRFKIMVPEFFKNKSLTVLSNMMIVITLLYLQLKTKKKKKKRSNLKIAYIEIWSQNHLWIKKVGSNLSTCVYFTLQPYTAWHCSEHLSSQRRCCILATLAQLTLGRHPSRQAKMWAFQWSTFKIRVLNCGVLVFNKKI